jgi:hypothetical protein
MVKRDPELLVAELTPVRLDAVEIDDLVDMTDSLDCFLLASGLVDVSDSVLGGNCGAGPDGCLGGNLGAALLVVSLEAHAGPPHSFLPLMADFQYHGQHQRQMRILQGEVCWLSVVSMEDPVSSLAS